MPSIACGRYRSSWSRIPSSSRTATGSRASPTSTTRLHSMLESKQGDYAFKAMDNLAARCLRGVRKLGMPDEIDHLLKLMAKMILGDMDMKTLIAKPAATTPATLRALLHVAGGWYYF